MFSSKPKKTVHFSDSGTSTQPASDPDRWVATLRDPPPPLPGQPYLHPHSYSLPFASTHPHPDPYHVPPPAQLPEAPYYFAPLGPGGGDVRGYLGRPTPVGEKPKEKEKEDKPKEEIPKEDKAKSDAEAEKQRAKAWEDYYRAMQQQGYTYPQQQQQAKQVIAPAPAPAQAKPAGGDAGGEGKGGGGGGGDAHLLPKISYYVPPGTTEGALLATWPKGVPAERSRTLMHAIYDG